MIFYPDFLSKAYLNLWKKIPKEIGRKVLKEIGSDKTGVYGASVDFDKIEREIKEEIQKPLIDKIKFVNEKIDKNVIAQLNKTFATRQGSRFEKNRFNIKVNARGLTVSKLKFASFNNLQSFSGFVDKNVDLFVTIEQKFFKEIRQAVSHSLLSSDFSDFKGIKDTIKDITGRSESYAEFVARDQIGKTLGDINEERQKEVGVESFEWVVTNDSRARVSHVIAAQTSPHPWDNLPIVDGERVKPGQPYQCRCIARAIFS